MLTAGSSKWPKRRDTADSSRLAWAFVISLAAHLLLAGGYCTGRALSTLDQSRWPAWLRPIQRLAEALKPAEISPTPAPPAEVPVVFVDVNPLVAAPEPPKQAPFYSSRNSQAANPETDRETAVPKITGEQTQVVKTEDIPAAKYEPLQPLPPKPVVLPQPETRAKPAPASADLAVSKPVRETPAPKISSRRNQVAKAEDISRSEHESLQPLPSKPAQPPQPEARAKPVQAPGDLTVGKPELTPRKGDGQEPHTRPRSLLEARARQESRRLPGEKMKQEGGVKRRAEISSVDAKATAFGAYDEELINAVSARWYSLLDQRDYAAENTGRVVLQFQLHYDGRVTGMSVVENTVSEVLALICQKAVLDPAPFATWPSDMRRLMGNTRKVQFTFYYN